ncbi:MAG: NAD(P)H-hydrate dehydratase [Terrimicrobiaceae bacterium]
MILTRSQMIDAESSAFARGVRAEDLMEVAGGRMADMVRQSHPHPGTCRVLAGKGHNGGDALVAARHLAASGWRIEVETIFPNSELAPLTSLQLSRLPDSSRGESGPHVVLDGLLGIGATGAARCPVSEAIERINFLRSHHGAWVLSADVPSGLDADTGSPLGPCVRADATLTMGFAKAGLVDDRATEFVGRLAVASLPDVVAPTAADPACLAGPAVLAPLVPPRPFEIHKGTCGRVAVVAGSTGLTGAARLCSQAAVQGGAGLVTLYVPREIYPILAASAAPEVMVQPLDSLAEVAAHRFDVLAIGPGLGADRREQILRLIDACPVPVVIDADALNAISDGHMDILKTPAGPRLLTPHPGEMERLCPQAGRTRRVWLEDFVSRYPVTLLLKGSRTIIGEADQPPVFNTTGHPGMASGGMGDVLTGVCAALIAQGQSAYHAAVIGAWTCGRAAEIAIAAGASQESLRASDVSNALGRAFAAARANGL